MADFMKALEENKPAFGVDNTNLINLIRGGFYDFGEDFQKVYKTGLNFINEIRNSNNTQLLTILLEGKNGCGKTALAAKLALESGFPFVKLISPENFVGYSEVGKVSAIVKIFEDAYKSPLSLIVLDDIERLIEFIHIGPRFSNHLLQTLLVLIKKTPPNPDRKLMIIGTTSLKNIMQQMDIVDCFNLSQNIPTLRKESEYREVLNQFKVSTENVQKICQYLKSEQESIVDMGGISIKNMILSIDLALQNTKDGKLEGQLFREAFEAVHHIK